MSEREIEQDPRRSQARQFYDQGRFSEALAQLERAPESPESLKEKAEVLLALGEIEKAIESYEKIVKLLPDDPSPSVEMAGLLTSQGRYDEALEAYEQVIERGFENTEIHCGRALALRLNGNLEAAVKAYDAGLAIASDDGEILAAKADLLIELDRFPEAITYLRRADEAGGLDAKGWMSRGHSLANAGALVEAGQCYERALELDPEQIQALLGRASVLHRQGEIEGALEACEKAAEIRPGDAKPWVQKGILLANESRFSEALDCFENAVERDPQDKHSWATSGYCRKELGELEKGLEDFSSAITIDPDFADGWEGLANCLDEMGRDSESVSAFRHALKLEPDMPWANNNLGYMLASKFNRPEEALAYYDKSLSINPDEWIPLINKADALFALERYEEARVLLEDAAKRGEGHDKCMYLQKLGELYSEYLNDGKRALEYFEESEREGSHEVSTNISIAELLLRQDRHEEARERIKGVFEEKDEDVAKIRATAIFLLFASYAMTGELQEAHEKFAEFIAAVANPREPSAAIGNWSYTGFCDSIISKELDAATKFLLLAAIDLQTGHLAAPSLGLFKPQLPLAELPEPEGPPPLPEEEESGALS